LTELTCVPLPRSAADADRIAPHLTRNLGPSDAAFVSGALHAEFNSESEHQAECAVTGFGVPRLQQLLESKLGPMPGELANATPMERWDAVVGAWRESFGTRDPQILLAPDDSLTLVIRRLYDTESESHPEDVELLLAAIDTNPLALQIYASCLMNGCNGIAALPPGERLSWSLRAAKIGAEPAIDDVVAQMLSAGDAVTAAAWAEFHRALALAGCNTVPNGGNVASAMLGADRATRGLSPNERALADARAQELIERYGAQARAAQGCE
jgi:hypothetical protein